MNRLDRPRKGEVISYEWGCAIVDTLNDLISNPRVIAPLVNFGGAIGFGDNYLVKLVQTATTITARSGTTMGTGSVTFQSSAGGDLDDADGANIVRDVLSVLGNTVPSGKYGYVAWVNEQWHLIAADCA